MKYMLVIHEDQSDFAARNDPARAETYWAAWMSYAEQIKAADPDYTGAALQPPETGTTVSGQGDAKQVHDGPFADSKEQLGGFFIIDVDNLDIALELASTCPATKNGAVEVRPVLPQS